MSKPIENFQSVEQLEECSKYWIEKLFLTNWIFKFELDDDDIFDDYGNICYVLNTFQPVSRNSIIKIRKYDKKFDADAKKFCAEQTLVHELLHCKYNFIGKDTKDYANVYFDIIDHRLLDEMSESLIMARYNLTYDYFKNDKKKKD